MSDSGRIIVATHKPYWMPSDQLYLPVHVGAQGREPLLGFQRDDEGENISSRNANYCELTGLYWAWKNLDAEYLGIAHYRRYFASSYSLDKRKRIVNRAFIESLLEKQPVVLPIERNYFIETNYSQYVHAHHAEDLEQTRLVLSDYHPQYLDAYDKSMNKTHGHRFNMFVMRRDLLDEYCEWLFSILFVLERRLDISNYSSNDARVFGFISERLLDPWIMTRAINYVSLPVVNLESQHWLKKGGSFLARKVRGLIS